MALPTAAFARTDVRAKTIDEIRGAAGFAAAPAVLVHQGPHAGGTADTDNLSVRPVMLIPVDAIPDIMTNLPAGFYTYPAFYDNFLGPPLGSGDAALERRFTPLAQWWRAVCTAALPTESALEVATTAPANLRERRYLSTVLPVANYCTRVLHADDNMFKR